MGCAKRPQKIGCVTTQTSSFPSPVLGFNQAFNCLSDLALCSFAKRATPRSRNAAPVLVFPILVTGRRDACSLRRHSVNGSERSVPTKATPENEELFRCKRFEQLVPGTRAIAVWSAARPSTLWSLAGYATPKKMVIRSYQSKIVESHTVKEPVDGFSLLILIVGVGFCAIAGKHWL
jgi:hypothetical protein